MKRTKGKQSNTKDLPWSGRRIAPVLEPVFRRVMTVRDVSDYLRVHTSTVYRLLKRGELPAFKVGSDWRFNIESIDRWRLAQSSPDSVAAAKSSTG